MMAPDSNEQIPSAVMQYLDSLFNFFWMDGSVSTLMTEMGIVKDDALREPMLCYGLMMLLEKKVNEKIIAIDKRDGFRCLGNRIHLARISWGLSNADVANALGTSVENVLAWQGKQHPPCLSALSSVLQVPEQWLAHGDTKHLAADSPVGSFVGDDVYKWRKKLLKRTILLLADLPVTDIQRRNALVLSALKTDKGLAKASRHAGGYWQAGVGELRFCNWQPEYRGLAGAAIQGEPRRPPIYVGRQAVEAHIAALYDLAQVHPL